MSVNLVNGDTLNSDFTAIANSIRAKTGSASTLAYSVGDPSAFTSAIASIPSGGGVSWTDVWCGSETDFANISPKVSTTLYMVMSENYVSLYRMYVGDTLVYPKATAMSGYDFYIENVCFGNANVDTTDVIHFPQLFSTTNASRSWQIDLVMDKLDSGPSSSESVIFGTSVNSGTRIEFFWYNNSTMRVYTQAPALSGERSIGDYRNSVLHIIKDNSKLSFYDSTNTLITEFAFEPTGASDSQYNQLGFYKGTSNTYGRSIIIKSFGFKWLSPEPTP